MFINCLTDIIRYLFMFSRFRCFSNDFTVFLNFPRISCIFCISDFSIFGTLVHYSRSCTIYVHQLMIGFLESFSNISLALYCFLIGLLTNKHISFCEIFEFILFIPVKIKKYNVSDRLIILNNLTQNITKYK